MRQYNDTTFLANHNDSNSIMHYGVKGMKWGVRRYQNYDGSYTQRGLARFRKSEKKYDDAKARYTSAKNSGSTSDAKLAKRDMKTAKGQMNRDYKNLKKAHSADQGRELYRKGETITDNTMKRNAAAAVAAIGAPVAANVVAQLTRNYGAGVATLAGTEVVSLGYSIYLNHKNKKLRSYYGYSANINAY